MKNPGELAGRTDNNRVVSFSGAPELAGRLVEVRITGARARSLHGELADLSS